MSDNLMTLSDNSISIGGHRTLTANFKQLDNMNFWGMKIFQFLKMRKLTDLSGNSGIMFNFAVFPSPQKSFVFMVRGGLISSFKIRCSENMFNL